MAERDESGKQNLFVKAVEENIFNQFHRAIAAFLNGDSGEAQRQIDLATQSAEIYFKNRRLPGLTDAESSELRQLQAVVEEEVLHGGPRLSKRREKRYQRLSRKWSDADSKETLEKLTESGH